MRSFQILDINFNSVCERQYDIAIFASGYEARCVHVASKVDPCRVTTPLIVGFTEESKSKNRINNDNYFLEQWRSEPLLLSSDDEKPIYEELHEHTQSSNHPIRILIDYSSMSRLWYAAVLNWARSVFFKRVVA